jgi:hypothetical protein
LFADSVNLDARQVHGLHQTYHRFVNHFVHNRWYSYVTWVKWKHILVHLEIVLISKIGAWFAMNVPRAGKSVWAHPMVLLGDVGQVEARFGLFGDSVKLGTR